MAYAKMRDKSAFMAKFSILSRILAYAILLLILLLTNGKSLKGAPGGLWALESMVCMFLLLVCTPKFTNLGTLKSNFMLRYSYALLLLSLFITITIKCCSKTASRYNRIVRL